MAWQRDSKHRRAGALILLSAFIAVPASAAPSRTLTVGIPDNMPFSGYRESKARGLIARASLRALTKMGFKTMPRLVPYSRLYKWIHTGHLDVAVSVLKSPKRAALAHYSAPMAAEYTIILVPKDKPFHFDKPEDLRNLRIGAQLGFLYPGIDHLNLPLVRERDYLTSFPKVANGQFDGALTGSVTGLFEAQKMGILNRLQALPKALEVITLGAAFSSTAFGPEDVVRFDEIIRAMVKTPSWQRLLDESGAAPYIKDWPLITKFQ